MNIDEEVSRALSELTESIEVIGPIKVDRHTNYVARGLADLTSQRTNLCWCILGFVGAIFATDMSIDSAIGEGAKATDNLKRALEKRLDVGKTLSPSQKERKRDPLLQELISHILLLIHQRQQKFPSWLGVIKACTTPHLSPNDSGIDLVAIGAFRDRLIPIIGEVKAYEKNPWGGLDDACVKFTEVRNGDYDDEIRAALRDLARSREGSFFTKAQLADNIWREQGYYGALVGHDCHYGKDGTGYVDINFSSNRAEVLKQDPERLFFISSPFQSMRALFDAVADELVVLAARLSE